MRQAPVQIVTSGDMSGTINSNGVYLANEYVYSVQAVWSGTPTGTLSLQVSNDLVLPAVSGNAASGVTNWIDYTGSAQVLSGTAGSFMWNVLSSGYLWARLKYKNDSGAGSLNAILVAKGV